MRLGAKADLLSCLEAKMLESSTISGYMADVIIFEGSAVVQMLNPGASSTFQEYGDGVFTLYICDQLLKCNRIDIVLGVYRSDSLKS